VSCQLQDNDVSICCNFDLTDNTDDESDDDMLVAECVKAEGAGEV